MQILCYETTFIKDVGEIIAEETKGLKVERNALLKKSSGLKFESQEPDGSWAKKQLNELARTVRLLATQSQLLLSNTQTVFDRKFQ